MPADMTASVKGGGGEARRGVLTGIMTPSTFKELKDPEPFSIRPSTFKRATPMAMRARPQKTEMLRRTILMVSHRFWLSGFTRMRSCHLSRSRGSRRGRCCCCCRCDGGDDGRRPDPGAVDRSPASMTGGGTHARGLGGWVGWPEFFFSHERLLQCEQWRFMVLLLLSDHSLKSLERDRSAWPFFEFVSSLYLHLLFVFSFSLSFSLSPFPLLMFLILARHPFATLLFYLICACSVN